MATMVAVTTCRTCDKNITVPAELTRLRHLEPYVLCDACYAVQERDFSQKLPVKTRMLWRVAADSVEREG